MAITNVRVGESLVGDGNEIAHIDLILGRGFRGGDGVLQRPGQQQGRLHQPAGGGLAQRAREAQHHDVQQGHHEGRQGRRCRLFGPAQRAVARAVMEAVSEGDDPRGRSRRSVCLRRRVHSLGGRGRLQDRAVQLPGHQGGHRARRRRHADGRRGAAQKNAEHPFAANVPDASTAPPGHRGSRFTACAIPEGLPARIRSSPALPASGCRPDAGALPLNRLRRTRRHSPRRHPVSKHAKSCPHPPSAASSRYRALRRTLARFTEHPSAQHGVEVLASHHAMADGQVQPREHAVAERGRQHPSVPVCR